MFDFNCDVAQSYGVYKNDVELDIAKYASSINISAGFHAGDPMSIRKALLFASENNVAIGAHIGYCDIQGFGKRQINLEKEELEAVFTKEFTAHEDNDGETYGKDIANYLECYTDKDEWDDAVKKVAKLDGDNIYSAIKGYEEEKNWVADSIIRQIRTENGRADADKMKLIVKIIDSVWEYCKKYGTNSEDACRDLYELKQEIDKNPTQLISVDLPKNITSLGEYFFYKCSKNLKEVTLPEGITSIGQYCFYGCI